MRIGRIISNDRVVTVIFRENRAYDATKIFDISEEHLERDFFKAFTENEPEDSSFKESYIITKIDSYLSPLKYPGQIRDFYAFSDPEPVRLLGILFFCYCNEQPST